MLKKLGLVLVAIGLVASCRPVHAQTTVAEASTPEKLAAPIDKGLRIFICGHSFHIFNANFIGPIAELADLDGPELAGRQMIGGSSVTQHWDLPAEKNRAKEALKSGKVDVMTMSPNWLIPDPAIEKFVDLGLEHNPKMRFVVQMSWTAFDSMTRGALASLEERDTKTIADLKPAQDLFARAIEKQVAEINDKHDHRVVFVSPVGYAVLKLREAVIDGKAPGVKKQSELYRDLLGHGTGPIMALCCYVNYATIYRRSPEGLKPFDTFDGTVSPELHKLLQQIAWETVKTYEPSGVPLE